jgi:crotonobetainyl-CoA:carnitine CoA-transferase CaiB-like acyl-CoA transferase
MLPDENSRTHPLAGIRVLDFSRVLAGPLSTAILGDLGADVIKVERPGSGDDTRAWGPPFVGDDAAYFLALNRNKRSITLDLQRDEDRAIARRLALRSDVLVENFRPGLMDTFGLDYPSLRDEHPGLVYCSITAFSGESSRPGYDVIMQALSGLMSVTGPSVSQPTKVGVALIDVMTGLYAVVGILAALRTRDNTGQGELVTLSLFETAVAGMVNQAANYLLGGIVPAPLGNDHPNIVPYGAFTAADRPFILAVGNDRLFTRACEAIDRPDLAADERFATNQDRVLRRDELVAELERTLRTQPADYWLERLKARGVPCAPIRRMDDVFASPEGAALVETLDDPVRGALRLVANPLHLSSMEARPHRPPPRLGEHTEEILRELESTPGSPAPPPPSSGTRPPAP